MAERVSKAEMQLLEQMWRLGPASVREIQESLPEEKRPAYTTVQTMVNRLEAKNAVRRTRKIGNALIFEAVLTREAAYRRVMRELLEMFGGSAEPVVSHLVETGKLSLEDVRELERRLVSRGEKA